MKHAISGVLALTILTVSFSQAAAEIIHLKTAERIIGEITGEDDEFIHIKIDGRMYMGHDEPDKIKKSEIFVVTNSIGLVIWPEEFKGKMRMWKAIAEMSPQEYQNILAERSLEQQKVLNDKVGNINTTLIVWMSLSIAIVCGSLVVLAAN